ncbi:MAG: hypothetical protein JWQ21_2489 [Herminiimonas sp.]|nr:hypothetical protein [Herminiimonas sp.]
MRLNRALGIRLSDLSLAISPYCRIVKLLLDVCLKGNGYREEWHNTVTGMITASTMRH